MTIHMVQRTPVLLQAAYLLRAFHFTCSNSSTMNATLQESGKIELSKIDCDLESTLLGGQSFRWRKIEGRPFAMYVGVAFDTYWLLKPALDHIKYEAFANVDADSNKPNFGLLLRKYLRADINYQELKSSWMRADVNFGRYVGKEVRLLQQQPLENIISFQCSQNNNIKRITAMVYWFAKKYGRKLGHFRGQDEYAFPDIDAFKKISCNELEKDMREASFGYRAKFIARALIDIKKSGGSEWLSKLTRMSYPNARKTLLSLPGIGCKVADCICLMSLGHLDVVPVDTHVLQVAQNFYMPQLAGQKTISHKVYNDVQSHLKQLFGEYAGWAQAVLFTADLPKFKSSQNKKK